jgi:hypothetical protein
MHMSAGHSDRLLPVQRALRLRERMQQNSSVSLQYVRPLAASWPESSPGLYWNKVDLAGDDNDEQPHFCAAQP